MESWNQKGEGSGHKTSLDSCPLSLQLSPRLPKGGCRFRACCGAVRCKAEAGPCQGSPRPFQHSQAKVKPEPRLEAGLVPSFARVPATGRSLEEPGLPGAARAGLVMEPAARGRSPP